MPIPSIWTYDPNIDMPSYVPVTPDTPVYIEGNKVYPSILPTGTTAGSIGLIPTGSDYLNALSGIENVQDTTKNNFFTGVNPFDKTPWMALQTAKSTTTGFANLGILALFIIMSLIDKKNRED